MEDDKMASIVGTIIAETADDQLYFLVNKETKSFIITDSQKDCTALATMIEAFKAIVSINFDKLELVELTNACHEGENIPLYVFSYPPTETDNVNKLVKEPDQYAWLNHRDLKETFNQLNIEGVPSFRWLD